MEMTHAADMNDVHRGSSWRRTLKITFCVVCAFILCAMLFRVIWGVRTTSRLNDAVSELERAGEPIRLEDLNPDPVPDADNAARLLIQAAETIDIDADDDIWGQPYIIATIDQRAAVEAVVEPHRPALALVRQARSLSGIDWGVEFTSPAVEVLLPQIGPQRQLSRVMGRAAALDVYTGAHGAALETVRDILFAARALDEMPILISHLVASAEAGMACRVIEDVAHLLDLEAAGATRQQIEVLIEELLDDAQYRAGMRRGLMGERACLLDSTLLMCRGQFPLSQTSGGWFVASTPTALTRARALVLTPLLKADGVRCLEIMGQMIEAAAADDYPTAAARLPNTGQIQGRASILERVAGVPSLVLLPALDRAILLQFTHLANRRMAATALAMRLFEIDHGARPQALDELVPTYLTALPLDPFTDDGSTLNYVGTGGEPRLYAVGGDGVDDHGDFEPQSRPSAPHRGDTIFYLDGRPGEDSASSETPG